MYVFWFEIGGRRWFSQLGSSVVLSLPFSEHTGFSAVLKAARWRGMRPGDQGRETGVGGGEGLGWQTRGAARGIFLALGTYKHTRVFSPSPLRFFTYFSHFFRGPELG